MAWKAAAIGAAILAMAASCAARAADTKLEAGVAGTVSDAGFFIADKKGYFKQEGLDVRFTSFDSAAKMVAPLGAGQLDVGGGSVSAGFYNALLRGIAIKIVADKGSTPPGHGFQPLLVRKDLIDSGRYKTLKDLKGMKIAGSAQGSGSTSTMNELLKKAGLTPADVDRVFMGFSQQVIALQNKAVDAALITEPSATKAEETGAAARIMGDDEIYPNHQLAVVLYSGSFIKDKPDAAKAFMRAYLRAARDWNDALNKDGKLAGPQGDAVVNILTQDTSIKDGDLYRRIVVQGTNPDGHVDMPSLRNDLAYFKATGDVTGDITADQAVDDSFAAEAVKALGPYKPKAR